MSRIRFSFLVALSLLALGSSCPPSHPLSPRPGLYDYESPARLATPGGIINLTDGNLVLRRVDLDIETRLGTQWIGQYYNSADGRWRWSHEFFYDGVAFVDASGAAYPVDGIGSGETIPGSSWVIENPTPGAGPREIKTKGGLVHEFGFAGELTALHWSSGEYPRIEYERILVSGTDALGEIRQCIAPGDCELIFAMQYQDTANPVRITAIQDRAGREAHFSYDADGRLVSARDAHDLEQTDAASRGYRYHYDADNRITRLRNSESEWFEFEIRSGRIVELRHPGTAETSAATPRYRFEYDPCRAERCTSRVIDPTGSLHIVTLDTERRTLQIEIPAVEERYAFAWENQLLVEFELPWGGRILRTHDSSGDVVSETTPSGNTFRFTYAPHGIDRSAPTQRALARIEDDLGIREERLFDAQGRIIEIRNATGDAIRMEYDALSQLREWIDATGVAVSFSDYGPHGQPARIDTPGISDEREFDLVGNVTKGFFLSNAGLLPDAGFVSRSFDGDRNIARIGLDSANWWEFAFGNDPEFIEIEYRSDRQRKRIRRPFGGDTETAFDPWGRPALRREWVSGAWQNTQFERDLLGRTIGIERANGMRTATSYDPAGRVSQIEHSRFGIPESSAIFEYAQGRLARVFDSVWAGAESYEYDDSGFLARMDFPHGERSEHEYDVRGRTVRRTLFNADGTALVEFATEYDAADRPTRQSADGAMLLEFEYQDMRTSETRYGNGLTRRAELPGASGGVGGWSTFDAAGNTVEQTTNQVTTIWPNHSSHAVTTLTFGAALGSVETHEQYVLDLHARRLAGFVPIAGQGARLQTYDALVNLTSRTRVNGDFDEHRYNAEHNRLLGIDRTPDGTQPNPAQPLHQYTYDEAGFTVSRDGVPLSWNAAGQIASIGDAWFLWDARGRPVSRQASGGITYFRFGGSIEADSTGAGRAIDLGEVRIDFASGARSYRHLDFRGNVKFVTDDSGDVVSHYHYEPYGVYAVHGSSADSMRFAQGASNGELVVLGARIYDPEAARFLAPDPIEHLVNAYAYAHGNPVWFWDPSGASKAIAVARFAGATIGSAFGGVVGAATGAALGGPAGAIVGTVIGGAIGSILGEAAVVLAIRAASPETNPGPPPAIIQEFLPGNSGGPGGSSSASDIGISTAGPEQFLSAEGLTPPTTPNSWEDAIPGIHVQFEVSIISLGIAGGFGGVSGSFGGGGGGGGGCGAGSAALYPFALPVPLWLLRWARVRRATGGRE